MFKVSAHVEMNTDTYKKVIEGTELLAAKFNYDRIGQGKTPVVITEDYFMRQAIITYLESLRNEMSVENFN